MNRRSFLHSSSILALGSALFNKDLMPLYNNDFTKADFGNDFKWGVATAAYQIEGAFDKDGKGTGIWDTYSNNKRKIKDGSNGNIACNFYEHYASDIALVKEMNMDVFRFSLSWPRLIPDGFGEPNPQGIDFYHKVIDACLAQNIEPWITLYHWDLPQAIQDKGGWANREVIQWFEAYCELATKSFGDKVKNWMILNEPAASTALGYLAGIHAPGKIAPRKFLAAVHHTTMCQSAGARIVRKNVKDAFVGSTFSSSPVFPKNDKKRHQQAAHRMDILLNRLFIEPALGMGYPTEGFPFIAKIKRFIQPGDIEKLAFNFDFIGVQNYTRHVSKKSLLPFVWAMEVPPAKRGISEEQITEMGWEVYPQGIYEVLKSFAAYENIPPLIVTENGCAFKDVVENNRVHDVKRVQFFKDYLGQVLKAKKEGVDVRGYFAWTLMDNFEWQEGYRPRFGLVYTDFETQQRIIKDSGLWFKTFLE